MLNYTKGEWTADDGDSEIWGVFSDIDADGIAYLCEPNGKLLRSFDECKANAQLISAAPELYEACKGVIAKRMESHIMESAYIPPEIEAVYKALIKAEGKDG